MLCTKPLTRGCTVARASQARGQQHSGDQAQAPWIGASVTRRACPSQPRMVRSVRALTLLQTFAILRDRQGIWKSVTEEGYPLRATLSRASCALRQKPTSSAADSMSRHCPLHASILHGSVCYCGTE